jgi:hypothetical protein
MFTVATLQVAQTDLTKLLLTLKRMPSSWMTTMIQSFDRLGIIYALHHLLNTHVFIFSEEEINQSLVKNLVIQIPHFLLLLAQFL